MPEPISTTSNSSFIMSKYRILGKKGEGTFSEVLKCQNIKDGSNWACKRMKQHYESVEQVNSLREIQALRRLSPHGNILELHEVLFDKKTGTLVLVCELMDMNIYEMIRGRRHYLPEKKIRLLMYQLLKSVDHMHRNGIFHRDVKPENILIKDDVLKLADFGSCRSVYSKQPYTEYISTRWYRAPECLLTDGYYTYKMDIWSVGCVFFEIMSLHPLFPGSNEVDQIAKIHDIMGTPDPSILNKLRNKTRGMNFNFPPKKGTGIEKLLTHASEECIELIYQMCAYDPDERISAKQALKHSYFKELREAEKRAAVNAKTRTDASQEEDESRSLKASKDADNDRKVVKERTKRAAAAPGPDDEDKSQDNKASERTEAAEKAVGKPADKKEPQPQEERKKSPQVAPPVLTKKSSTSPTRSVRPTSGASSLPRYPGSILHNRDPLYNYHRREKRRRNKMRMTEPSPVSQTTGLLPKVSQVPSMNSKSPGYQPSFHFGAGSLPKIAGATNSTTTTTFLPSLGQAFVRRNKSKQVAQAGTGTATKNMFGHYQLPSIDRRGNGN